MTVQHVPDLIEDEASATRRSRRPLIAGAAAGAWSLLVGIALVTCVVMLVWAVSPNSAGTRRRRGGQPVSSGWAPIRSPWIWAVEPSA